MRTFLPSSLLVVALVATIPAQQLSRPPQDGGVNRPHVVQFTVRIQPEDLQLRPEILENKAVITHVELHPSSGEPVFYPDQPGYPRLPRLARLVALPPGVEPQAINAVVTKTATIKDVQMVGWASLAQPGQQPSDNPNEPRNRYAFPPVFPLDDQKREVYYPAAPHPPDPGIVKLKTYPEDVAIQQRIQPHGDLAGVLRIDIAPVQWHVDQGELSFATEIQIDVIVDGRARFRRPQSGGEANMYDDLRHLVVNPFDLPFALRLPGPIDVPYLIVTDDNFWTANFERTPGANLVAEFERLAQWKRAKGLRTSVIRVTDIVDGYYGDFRSGARDLQETIRNFLKFAESNYDTQWVLLGGDIEVIPPRKVSVWGHVNAAHYYQRADDERPKPGRVYWDAANNRVLMNVWGTGFIHMLSPRTGRSFTNEPRAGLDGWRVVDSALCDMTDARRGSRCIELTAPAADIENTNIALVLPENTIPTDLYYASLRGPEYGLPGLHDWDKNDDGLYGTNLWDRSADGVSYWPTLRLGRAPVGNAAEADSFVDKLLAYEREPSSLAYNKLLLAADYWSGGPTVRRGTANPPAEGEFYYDEESRSTLAHFASAPSPATDWTIISWRTTHSWRELSYTRDAGLGVDGYYYCTDATCSERSEFYFPIGIFGPPVEIPFPTKFVKVHITESDFREPAKFFFDHHQPDGAITEKEQIKAVFDRHFGGISERRRLYKDIYDIPAAPDLSELFIRSMTDELFTRPNIASLSGHGWFGGCCGLDRDTMLEETRIGTAGVVYADSCLTNEFDEATGDAIGELMLTMSRRGAVAYVGNSRFSWIGLGSSFERAFWLRLRTSRHVGALHNTKAAYTSDPNEQWTNFSLNLMGDPELEIWRRTPRPMRIAALREVFQGNRIDGQVLVAGVPVPLARLTLIGPGVFQTVVADFSGNFSFGAAGRVGDSLQITATHNLFDYLPGQHSVNITRRVVLPDPRPRPRPPGLPGRP